MAVEEYLFNQFCCDVRKSTANIGLGKITGIQDNWYTYSSPGKFISQWYDLSFVWFLLNSQMVHISDFQRICRLRISLSSLLPLLQEYLI